jgi:hypothetical protein
MDADFDERVKKAEKTVAFMDQHDGWTDRELPTVLAALECGLKRPETNSHFDAFVMLRDRVNKGDR